MGHIKEPWAIRGHQVVAGTRQDINIAEINSHDSIEQNARRIVACVNACEGISTEALESEVKKTVRGINWDNYNQYESMREEVEFLRRVVENLTSRVFLSLDGKK